MNQVKMTVSRGRNCMLMTLQDNSHAALWLAVMSLSVSSRFLFSRVLYNQVIIAVDNTMFASFKKQILIALIGSLSRYLDDTNEYSVASILPIRT
jgi:hypothetical protein